MKIKTDKINKGFLIIAVLSLFLNFYQFMSESGIKKSSLKLEQEKVHYENSPIILVNYLTITGTQLENFINWAENKKIPFEGTSFNKSSNIRILRNETYNECYKFSENAKAAHKNDMELTILIIENRGKGIALNVVLDTHKTLFKKQEGFNMSFDFKPPDYHDSADIYEQSIHEGSFKEKIRIGNIEVNNEKYIPLVHAVTNRKANDLDLYNLQLVWGTMYEPIKLNYQDISSNSYSMPIRSMFKYEFILNREAWTRG